MGIRLSGSDAARLRPWILTCALVASLLSAWVPRAQAEDRPAIRAGREAEVLALFAPCELHREVTPGWVLAEVRIPVSRVDVLLKGPGDQRASLSLVHPDAAGPADPRTASFAIQIAGHEGEDAAGPPLARLVEAVKANDPGSFWDQVRVRTGPQVAPPCWGVSLWRGLVAWFTDGCLLLAGLTGILLGLALRRRGDEPDWMRRVGLPVVLAVGLGLRLLLSPDLALGVWPYARTHALAQAVYQGPVLAWISGWIDSPFFLDRVTAWTTFALGGLAPLAVFVHGRYLLDSDRDALLAAALIALLPSHIRFSLSEVAFVPSLVLSAFAFALTHVALRDRSRRWRILALVGLLPTLAGVLVVRPLNVLFVPLLVAVPLFLRQDQVPRWRIGLVAAGVGLVGTGLGAYHLLTAYPEQVVGTFDLDLLLEALWWTIHPAKNSLLVPTITPPLFGLLAVAGTVVLWRRERRKALFLCAWLLGFLYFHATVTAQEAVMQARYHLHLAVPFVLLAASSFELVRRLPRWALAGIALIGLASPAIHAGFIRDVDYNEVREFSFVRELRAQVPDGCAVLEYAAHYESTPVPRFRLLGRHLLHGQEQKRFDSVSIGAHGWRPGAAGDPLSLRTREVLNRTPACTYYYEGLVCYSHKPVKLPLATACQQIHERADLELVREVRFPSRLLDHQLAVGFHPGLDEIALRLYRLGPARAGEPKDEEAPDHDPEQDSDLLRDR